MAIKILIIDNDINKVDKLINSFNFGVGSTIQHIFRPTEAVEVLFREYFDIIFLDFFLVENDSESAFRVLNSIFDKDIQKHGIVFLVSQNPEIIESNPEWKRKINGYPLINNILDFNKIQKIGSAENKKIQIIIDAIRKIIDNHRVIKKETNHTDNNSKIILERSLKILPFFLLVYLSIEYFMPYLRSNFPGLPPHFFLPLVFIIPVIFFAILYWAEALQIIHLIVRSKK